MKRIILGILLLIALPATSLALDTTIRVLAVHPSNHATAQDLAASFDHMVWLREAWLDSDLDITSNVTVTLINGGSSVPLGISLTGGVSTQLNSAKTKIEQSSIANTYGADVVLVFSRNTTGACGKALQPHWIIDQAGGGSFVALPPNGLDLRGAVNGAGNGYVAIVDLSCDVNLGAHEFGHLLGGGHVGGGVNPHPYLNPDSHAYAGFIDLGQWGGFLYFRTALSNENECIVAGCSFLRFYSDNLPNRGDFDHRNVRTFDQTALSVANYRTGSPPPPVLKAPVNVSGYQVAACNPPPWTEHFVTWQEGGSTAPVEWFEVWYSQPDGWPYVYGWSRIFENSPVFVTGAHSRIKVRTCNSSVCTVLSSSSYLATSNCSSG